MQLSAKSIGIHRSGQRVGNGSNAAIHDAFALIKANNATPATEAKAALASMDADGFTLTWDPNDGEATKIGYLAIG